MKMKITDKWLNDNGACQEAITWLKTVKNRDIDNIFNLIVSWENREMLSWGNWGIVRLMNHEQKIKYAIFAAEQVIDIFEEKYPDDNRPAKAIKAAKNYLNNPETAKAADAAADAAYDAYAAYAAAYDAAADAAYATYAAAHAVASAAYAVAYAASAADAAADAASAATDAGYAIALKIKILTYGMQLINS